MYLNQAKLRQGTYTCRISSAKYMLIISTLRQFSVKRCRSGLFLNYELILPNKV